MGQEFHYRDVVDLKLVGPEGEKVLVITKKNGDAFAVALSQIRSMVKLWGNNLYIMY